MPLRDMDREQMWLPMTAALTNGDRPLDHPVIDSEAVFVDALDKEGWARVRGWTAINVRPKLCGSAGLPSSAKGSACGCMASMTGVHSFLPVWSKRNLPGPDTVFAP